MMNQFKWIFVSTAFLISIPSVHVYAQNELTSEDSSMIDIKALNCGDLTKLSDGDQEATLAYYHGFMSGQNNEFAVDVDRLGNISDKVVDHCIHNSKDSLFEVFEQSLKN